MESTLPPVTLTDGNLTLAFDRLGRIVGFESKEIDTAFLTVSDIADNWKLLVPEGRYGIVYILGKEQTPDRVESTDTRVEFSYDRLVHDGVTYPISVVFSAWLVDGEARFALTIANNHAVRVREAWYPILAGFEGWAEDGEKHIVDFAKSGLISPDILRKGLPNCMYVFGCDGETARYSYPERYVEQMNFIDLYSRQGGLYISTDDRSYKLSTLQLQKEPTEVGTGGERTYDEVLVFPADTPRWLTISTGRVTTVEPGETWTTPDAVIWPHRGDWHAAAKHYRMQVDRWMVWPERTKWLDNYVGWHQLVGKTYLNEYYFTFAQATETMIEVQERSGIDVLMLYGHTEFGCESAPFDIQPGDSLGGPAGFATMCDELHARGMKAMIFGHRQSALATDEPLYDRFRDWTILDRDGVPRREVWYKTTLESFTMAMGVNYEGTGPIWHRVCPYCDDWWESFRDQLLQLIALGLDGYQLDLVGVEGTLCFAENHGHRPGEGQLDKLVEQILWLRSEIHAVKPDFLFAGEELRDWQFQCMDLPYSRYRRNNDGQQVFRYTFPDMREQAAVGAYSYDQASKALMLGLSMNIEVNGLKQSLTTCPDFADYLGEINHLRRRFPEYLISGEFQDTEGAMVHGDLQFSVLSSPNGNAVVLRNPTVTDAAGKVSVEGYAQGLLCRPGLPDQLVSYPDELVVPAHGVAVYVPVPV
jgi:hypothetical protein